MRQHYFSFFQVKTFACLLFAQGVFAQGYDDPLTIQGIDHTTMQSAASRASGGTTVGILNDVSLMFTNPASLQSLSGIQFSLGAVQRNGKSQQVQQYSPLKYYSNFSLVMEGLTGYIPNFDTSLVGSNAGDSLQRPFDTIEPNWSRSKSQGLPIQALVAVPFSMGGGKFVVGFGAVQYADLNQFYQNNNVLSPAIGSDRPVPVALPPSDSTPVRTNWSAFRRARDGVIRGYGLALSGALSEKISLGVSGMILRGSTNDFEQRVGRGRFVFYREWFRLDSVSSRSTVSGSSDFSGEEFTLSGVYRGRFVSLGFALKPPASITRKFTSQVQSVDSAGTSSATISGQDKIRLPWRGNAGFSITATELLTLGVEYEIRSYASAVYNNASGGQFNPWLSSSLLRVGASYQATPGFIVRAGIRGEAEVFEPTGNPIPDEPVVYSVYSAGFGLLFNGVRFNFAYEYASIKYQDMWQTNVNLNSETLHNFVVDVSYQIPWGE